jgi:menaquinone-dependent protoporphyrinogen oxidase
MTRRGFLKVAGVGIGATVLTCSGLAALATRAPTVDFYESKGEGRMNDKVLIAYASKCGSTGEVAEAIAKELAGRGKAVDVRLAQNVSSLNGYQAVIVGSAIRMGQWLPEAVKFVETHQQALRQLPTAFFTVHMMNLGDDETARMNRLAYLDPVRKIMMPQQEVFFAGKMDLARLSFLDRLIAKTVKATDADLRDWQAIRGWAKQIF